MFLFPVEGTMEVILSYGQTISLFLVFVIMEGVIAAKSESHWPGLIFILATVLLGVALGIMFRDIAFFYYLLVPAVMSLIAFFFTRRNRRKNKLIPVCSLSTSLVIRVSMVASPILSRSL